MEVLSSENAAAQATRARPIWPAMKSISPGSPQECDSRAFADGSSVGCPLDMCMQASINHASPLDNPSASICMSGMCLSSMLNTMN